VAETERMKTNPRSVGTGRVCDPARYKFNCRVGGDVSLVGGAGGAGWWSWTISPDGVS
jgi:hypothetical protein